MSMFELSMYLSSFVVGAVLGLFTGNIKYARVVREAEAKWMWLCVKHADEIEEFTDGNRDE